MTESSYTFVCVATAKPGRLDDLVRLTNQPEESVGGRVPGTIARQVSIDIERSVVTVWVTVSDRRDLHDFVNNGTRHLGDPDAPSMGEIVETFEMYELTPTSGPADPEAGVTPGGGGDGAATGGDVDRAAPN